MPDEGAEGVLYARGGHNVGHSFFVKGSELHFDYNAPFPFTGTIDRITFRIRSRADATEVAATARAELAKE